MKVGEHMHGMGSVPAAGEDGGFCAIASEAIFCPSTGPLPVPHHEELGITMRCQVRTGQHKQHTLIRMSQFILKGSKGKKNNGLSVTANL